MMVDMIFKQLLRNLTLLSEVSTFVGSAGHPGNKNANGLKAQFRFPFQIVYSKREKAILVADYGNHFIRKVTMEGSKSE